MLFPTLPHSAQAVEGDAGVSTYANTPTVSINVPSTINFTTITPTAAGTTTTATANLTVITTDSAGYSLYLYSSDGNNSLTSINPANTSTIDAINNGGVGLTLSSLEPNTWGYNLGTANPSTNTTYTAVPTTDTTPIQTKDTSSTNSANDTYTLSFGAKVDTTIASGTYTNSLTVAVVADPPAVSGLTSITYMQEMTPEICANSNENDTTRLIDSRDGKYYWVAKLKDGNCWMTQNLDLDLTEEGLSPSDSDISTAWNRDSTYPPQTTSTTIADVRSTSSYDPGLYVKNAPANYQLYCNSSSSAPFESQSCIDAGWTDVSSFTAMNEENQLGTSIIDDSYDAHYLVGNFYAWNIAVAGSYTQGTEAPDSICPKGWHLPSDSSNDFYTLLNSYGIGTITDGNVALGPLYIQYSGSIFYDTIQTPTPKAPDPGVPPHLTSAGSSGTYWTSSSGTLLYINNTQVSPSSTFYTWPLMSVRCLAD